MIKKLPTAVVNQIAAGEVVERPVSVAKELIENSLDAGATRVRVELRGGGAEQLTVIDDGDGFMPEDLPLAFASHATSKLSEVHDLEHIGSLGFRGEALASIGAVAKARVQSKRAGASEGWEVRCDGGVETAPQPCGCPQGTRIEIRDLFFNVPARRRFLKAAHAERARIQQLVCELALARLDVDFTLISDEKELLRLPRGASLAERVQQCFGRELGKGLMPVHREFDGLKVEGVVGEPDLARRDGRLELTYVNGRMAREKSALHAVRQAYREFLMGGRFPVYVLQMVLPPELVDVNIHPRKAEVRFVESRKVAGCLHETVRSALQSRTMPMGEGAAAAQSEGGVSIRPELPRARSGFPTHSPSLFQPGSGAAPAFPVADAAATPAQPAVVREPGGSEPPAEVARPNPFRRAAGRFLQVMDLYLLIEGDDGLLVVDQHALHERVTYEQLKQQHAARDVQVQRLLVPAVVELTPSEIAWFESVKDELAEEGLLVDAFGPNAIAVQGMPAVLSRTDPKQLIRALATGEADEGKASVGEHIAERFHSMACRGSVMSGDRLTDAEIEELLRVAATLEHPHNCPHGRPTTLTFSSAELERYFRRRC
ncbi:MAG: DNA mismatch repair endonuclease MutL [Planctomycetota bacterium]|nr:DNA mismatch repair endonuclease MutL [Planctomycetota bacterium]